MASNPSHGEVGRYRVEGGDPCIDVSVGIVEQLFDHRDPAPFRKRDLDPDLVAYLRDAAEDLARRPRYKVVFWIATPCPTAEIEEAFRAEFAYELDRLRRRRNEQRRTGHVTLALAVAIAAVLLTGAQLIGHSTPGLLGAGLREGLVVLSWVVMWRPIEVLLYDWIPIRRERRIVTKLLEAPIEVRLGTGPSASGAAAADPQRPAGGAA